jgi:hypothetical protein
MVASGVPYRQGSGLEARIRAQEAWGSGASVLMLSVAAARCHRDCLTEQAASAQECTETQLWG